MGNNQCCHPREEKDYGSQINVDVIKPFAPQIEPLPQRQEQPSESPQPEIKQISVEIVEEQEIPALANIIKEKVEAEKYFADQLKGDLRIRRFGNEIYEGELDQHNKYPHGFGRMYKADGSFYVGRFRHGKADGQGAYLTPEGLVYHGHFHNNHAQGEGKYEFKGVTYEGHFLNNLFHGAGKEVSPDYEFEGDYYEGKKSHGIMKWSDGDKKDYIYTGHFNFNNQFHGDGILGQPNGIYSGSFIDGYKHGKGTYKYNTGLKYEGEYHKGKKQGKGTIYNFNNSIAYEGEFDNDMPHGKGYVYDEKGVRHATTWVQGIDSSLL